MQTFDAAQAAGNGLGSHGPVGVDRFGLALDLDQAKVLKIE